MGRHLRPLVGDADSADVELLTPDAALRGEPGGFCCVLLLLLLCCRVVVDRVALCRTRRVGFVGAKFWLAAKNERDLHAQGSRSKFA